MANAAVLPLEGRLETALGSGVFLAYYDPNLDITWAQDANINGEESWDNQIAWAAGLTLGGVSGWRLPSMDVNGDGPVVDCFGGGVAGCADNEYGYLYWEEGITGDAPGPFSNVVSGWYWSGTERDFASAYQFNFNNGHQSLSFSRQTTEYAWAVHDGDIPKVVPIPAAVWLFASGLIGLPALARRKRCHLIIR
jgi:hypothetical protein